MRKRGGGGQEGGKGYILASGCGDRCLFVSVFSRYLVLKLFPFPLTPAQLLGDGLLSKGCAANC
jgi:hypothetical protein